jgi:hypothetical protein
VFVLFSLSFEKFEVVNIFKIIKFSSRFLIGLNNKNYMQITILKKKKKRNITFESSKVIICLNSDEYSLSVIGSTFALYVIQKQK